MDENNKSLHPAYSKCQFYVPYAALKKLNSPVKKEEAAIEVPSPPSDKRRVSLPNIPVSKKVTVINMPSFLQKIEPTTPKNLDTLLGLIGPFGLYQKFEFFLIGFLAILPSMVAYSYVFVSATPRFTCKTLRETTRFNVSLNLLNQNSVLFGNELIGDDGHSKIESTHNIIENRRLIRLLSDKQIESHVNGANKILFDNKCKLASADISHLFKSYSTGRPSQLFDSQGNKIDLVTKSYSSKLSCVEWYYDTEVYGRTFVSESNLVCVKSHLKAATQNTFILGTGCSVFSGILADRFGRRTTMISLIFVMFVVLNVTQVLMHSGAISTNTKVVLFIISRFFQGMATTMYSVSFVLLLEITGPKNRVTAGNILAYSFSIGQMILVGMAYWFKDWHKIQWMLALYVMPFFVYYWLVPESPRWLLSQGKVDEAKRVLLKITRVNQQSRLKWLNFKTLLMPGKAKQKPMIDFESDASAAYMFTYLQEEANKLDALKKNTSYSQTARAILNSPLLIRRCLIIFYTWMVILAVYLGIGMGISGNLDKLWDPYLVFLIAACCEFVSIVTCHLVLNKYGRKLPFIVFMSVCSMAVYLIPVYFHTLPRVSIAFYFLAKYAIGAAQTTFMIYTSELYPTPLRSTGVGLSVAVARLGGVWAPQINVLNTSIGSFNTPFMIFSGACLLAAFFCLFLPETLNKPLPETALQAEQLNRRQK